MDQEMPKEASKEQKVGSAILEEIRINKLIKAVCHTCQQPVALIHAENACQVIGEVALKAAAARTKAPAKKKSKKEKSADKGKDE